jgi:uncharacterized protein DUF6655
VIALLHGVLPQLTIHHRDTAPMHWLRSKYVIAAVLTAVTLAGCGTTRSTDTNRTATEQLLVSDAIDRAVQSMNLQTLAGQTVFLDDTKLTDVVDRNYLISTLRQYLLANNCQLRDKKEDADFIVEARAGAVGTDRNDMLFGLPSMNVPQIPLVQPVPAVIPEIPIAKRKDQRGVAKIAVFAYHRQSGMPVWQSGLVHEESSANDVWILGAGPFQRGTIFQGTEFAGNAIKNDQSKEKDGSRRLPPVDLVHQNTFTPPQRFAKQTPAVEPKVVQATHQAPAPAAVPAPAAAGNNAAATPAAVATPKPPDAPQTAAKPAAAPMPIPPPAGLSASVDKSQTALPQPRFNSPQ